MSIDPPDARAGRPPNVTGPRILVLCPHDPSADPRVGWVANLCAEYARTDVIGAVHATDRPWCEYDGRLYIERMHAGTNASPWAHVLARLGESAAASLPGQRRAARSYRELEFGPDPVPPEGWFAWLRRKTDRAAGEAAHYFYRLTAFGLLMSAMRRRARAVSVVPDLVVCADLFALVAGIQLKKTYGCPVIYDNHEFSPEADMMASGFEVGFWAWYERGFVRQADAVVCVSPQLGEHTRRVYGLKRVVVVPNAAPRAGVESPAHLRAPGHPVRFLFQGGAAHGRGLDRLVATWDRWADPRTVLYLRARDGLLLSELKSRYAAAVARGTVVFLPAVVEEEMIDAATFADVGVIPYPPTNRNHLYCCPNKLSQYMQAGLAILAADTVHLRQRLAEFECGLVYDYDRPETLIAQAERLRDDPALLARLKGNAYRHSQETFNWETVAGPFRELIEDLVPSLRGQREVEVVGSGTERRAA
jgi:glycosyltransferase involved in cell wall biosynthesis